MSLGIRREWKHIGINPGSNHGAFAAISGVQLSLWGPDKANSAIERKGLRLARNDEDIRVFILPRIRCGRSTWRPWRSSKRNREVPSRSCALGEGHWDHAETRKIHGNSKHKTKPDVLMRNVLIHRWWNQDEWNATKQLEKNRQMAQNNLCEQRRLPWLDG